MSRKYKFLNTEGLYFVSFATVYWVDVFVREDYFSIVLESLKYCQKELGMEVYFYCIMTIHVHLIFRAKESNPSDLMKSLKTFTSKKLQTSILENSKESRREWLSWFFKKSGEKQ